MAVGGLKSLKLTENDLDFLIDTVVPKATDRLKLREIVRNDVGFRNNFIEDEKVFRRVMDDEEIFVRISPTLFFEILLRRAVKDLEMGSYTIEKSSSMKIPVFDAKELSDLLKKESLLHYLADMLSSFTRTETYRISFRVGKGVWQRIHFSDLDIHSLMNVANAIEEENRLGLYKRIADLCLFILGIFPDYAERDYRYPFSRELRPSYRGKVRISPEEYEREGVRFYRLAAEHTVAKSLEVSDVFRILCENFQKAKKPLNFITEHYLHQRRHKFFM